jgi:hypothetical protein
MIVVSLSKPISRVWKIEEFVSQPSSLPHPLFYILKTTLISRIESSSSPMKGMGHALIVLNWSNMLGIFFSKTG